MEIIYHGTLGTTKMSHEAKRAYQSWRSQKKRCYLKSDKQFKYYGAKGIQVKYSSREFVSWWLYWIEQINFPKDQATCGRINHDGDYCFDNIKMESKSENSRETVMRNDPFSINHKGFFVEMLCKKCNCSLRTYQSIAEASRDTSLNVRHRLFVQNNDKKDTTNNTIWFRTKGL
jgi:hypothetical protein